MTGEFTVTFLNQYINLVARDTIPSETMSFDQTTQGLSAAIAVVGNGAEEDLPLGDVATPGLFYARNLDPTNYVTWGPKSGGVMVAMGRLESASVGAGDFVWIRFDPGATLRWQANAAPVRVLYRLFEL